MKQGTDIIRLDARGESLIMTIPGSIYKHRERISALIQSLNRKYLGEFSLIAVEWIQAGRPDPSLTEMDRLRRRRVKHGLSAI